MIISIDPGKITGLFAVIGDYLVPHVNTEEPATGAMMQLENLLGWRPIGEHEVYVVCERYTQQSLKLTPQYDALEVIGVVRWLTYIHINSGLTLQSRSQKRIVTDDMLKAIGWWTSGLAGHANDAARHALIFLATRNPSHPLVMKTIGTIAAIG